MSEAWRTPRKLTRLEVVFPAVVTDMMPPYGEIPKEFRQNHGTKWNELFSQWFFFGLNKLTLKPKPGINEAEALGVIRAIMGSFEPSHEHKEAAVAYLLSLWFEDDAIWETNKGGAQ